MLNLKLHGAQDHIEIFGAPFFLNTDYRVWLDFPEKLDEMIAGRTDLLKRYFIGEPPPFCQETVDEMAKFYYIKPEIPRTAESDTRLIDYDIDANYIFAAFLQAYGIDLIETDLHWHKFQALIDALPEQTMMTKIMQYRGYNGKSGDYGYSEYISLKQDWALPEIYNEEEMEKLDKFNSLFK